MGKYFGTDGFRGNANVDLTAVHAFKIGLFLGWYYAKDPKMKRPADYKASIAVGKDTRLSGYMLESAITAGLLSMGMDVLAVGPMPTPAVAHLVRSFAADCGIMITASHNPAEDNGIKIFDRDGFKLSDAETDALEALILGPELPREHVGNAMIGKARRIDDARGRYIEFAKAAIGNLPLTGLKMVLDCANGAAYAISPAIFRELGAEVIVCGAEPDGTNINENCGATHPETLCRLVLDHHADLGIALDGDADRVIFSDADGRVVDGDRIIGMIALDARKRGVLKRNTCVVTSMSNLGFHRAMKANGIDVITTDVGDHLVIEAMREHRCSIGGEQSGHVIFMDFVTTGDGIITALHVMKLMREQGKSLAELADFMTPFAQKMVNLPVKRKLPLNEMSRTQAVLTELTAALGDSGRAVVRFSGTENKLRILTETETAAGTEMWSARLLAAAEADLKGGSPC